MKHAQSIIEAMTAEWREGMLAGFIIGLMIGLAIGIYLAVLS